MAFGRTSLDFRRRRDLEDILQGCIAYIFIGDFFSRNPEVRGGGIQGLMHNDNRAIDQLMIDDLIRRYVVLSYFLCRFNLQEQAQPRHTTYKQSC
jgi:hypothetical protein